MLYNIASNIRAFSDSTLEKMKKSFMIGSNIDSGGIILFVAYDIYPPKKWRSFSEK